MNEILSIIPIPIYAILIFVVLVWISVSFQKYRFIYKDFIETVQKEFPDEDEMIFEIGKNRSLTMKDQSLSFFYKNELVSTAGIQPIVTEDGSVQRNIIRFDKPFRKELEEWMVNYMKVEKVKNQQEKTKNRNKIQKLKKEYKEEIK